MLIMGDTIIDSTWYVNAIKLSPEAPIPTVYLGSPDPILTPGGASLAAAFANRHSLESMFVTTIEDRFCKWLQSKGIDIVSLADNYNIVKTRYIDIGSGYHMLRVDNDSIVTPHFVYPLEIKNKLTDIIETNKISCITILDYQKGMFNVEETCHTIISIANKNNIPVYVDTRGDPLKYIGCDFIKLNEKEYNAAASKLNINSPLQLTKKLNVKAVIVTKGKNGASIYTSDGKTEYKYVPDLRKYNGTPDVTGCGDVFDINFCYNRFIEGFSPTKSLKLSVEKATKYAYELVSDRL